MEYTKYMINNEFISIINEIKSRLLLSDIIKKDIKLIRKGKEYIGTCPFHVEKTASFFVSDEKGSFYCFGCGISGDIFKYIIQKEGLTFYQALKKLAELANVKLPENNNNLYVKENNVYKILNIALAYYKHNINMAIDYCNKRDIKNIKEFNIGFAPDNNELYKLLLQNNFSQDDINKSGLFLNNNFNRFRNRLMFPIFDNKNRVIAFGGRSIDGVNPKYLNSPDTDVFHKHLVLFAFNIASNNVSNKNPFIIVEGYMDVLTMHQFGFTSTIGTMGTALSEEHLCNIWKYCDEPIICMDGDNAGYKSMVRTANMALSKLIPGKSLKFVIIPNNDDPDSYIKSYGKDAMQQLIDNNLNLIDFLWAYFVKEFLSYSKTPEKIALWEQEIYNTIDKISNNRIRTFYRQELKNRIYYFTKQLFYTKSSYKPNNDKVVNEYTNGNLNEKLLLYILIMRPVIIQFVIEDLFRITFSDKSVHQAYSGASLNDIRNSIAEFASDATINIDKIKQKYSVVINDIIKQCSKVYKIDKQTDDELIDYWYYLLDRVIFASQESNEIKYCSQCNVQEVQSKNDNNEINNSSWQRLKSLKMYLLSRRRK